MFSEIGKYEPCGIFTKGHFVLLITTIIGIIVALKYTCGKSKKQVHNIIKHITIIAYVLEVIKIIFNIKQNSIRAVNTYMPLYYCSILLYAGLLSSYGKSTLKRVGDVSLATGAIIGGIVFIIYPSTSLPMYPTFHFLSIHSFLFHGAMIYLGIMININNYIKLEKEDIKYFASLIGFMGIAALIINKLFDGNLMFISNNFPGTPIEILYEITNGGLIYTLIMLLAQMTIPFYLVYYPMSKLYNKEKNYKTYDKNEIVEKIKVKQ